MLSAGHPFAEVAHDHVPEIKRWVVQEKHKKNSYDTWHGMRFNFNVYSTVKPLQLFSKGGGNKVYYASIGNIQSNI